MTAVVSVSAPRREVIQLHLQQRLLARAVQDQLSQNIRPPARESVQLNLPILLQAKERGSDQLNLQIRRRGRARRVSLRKARRASFRRASPRKALRRAPPTRASPRTSATARARARSEAARVVERFFLRRNPHYAFFSQFVFHDAHGMHQFLMVSRLTCCISCLSRDTSF